MNLKGVILAGGRGERLRPLTDSTNKHLLPVAGRPMILHAMGQVARAGVRDLTIVTGAEHVGAFESVVATGAARFDSVRVAAQESARGIADALAQAEPHVAGSRLLVALGDNLTGEHLKSHADRFESREPGAMVLLKEVRDTAGLGVARVEGDRVVEIIEKPPDPGPGLAVTGFYFYDERVFDIIRSIAPGGRGELEITSVNNEYARRGELDHAEIASWWVDAGTHEGLAEAARLVGASRGLE